MKKRTLAEAFRPGQRDMRAVSILHRCIMKTDCLGRLASSLAIALSSVIFGGTPHRLSQKGHYFCVTRFSVTIGADDSGQTPFVGAISPDARMQRFSVSIVRYDHLSDDEKAVFRPQPKERVSR